MIDKKDIISRHNVKLKEIDYESFLSVGNGEFVFNTDITGMQSLYKEYDENEVPLCTMSQWGWHSVLRKDPPHRYTFEDLNLTHYKHNGKDVSYAVKEHEGNEVIYNWLRKNPHKFNLGNIGMLWKGKPIDAEQVRSIDQELNLYTGTITSSFMIENILCKVVTVASQSQDSVSFSIESEGLKTGDLSIAVSFPYGSHKKSGSDWNNPHLHDSEGFMASEGYSIERKMDETSYWCKLTSRENMTIEQEKHVFKVTTNQEIFKFTALFTENETEEALSFEENRKSSKDKWQAFWEKGGMIDFSQSKDLRADELERRMVLSLYLIAIQGTGSLPPQETGLSMNSWYGKFHLEMHLWHNAFLPLWGHEELIMPSLRWYKDHLSEAEMNARRNGYAGARWPKMIGNDAIDSPSIIATLLVWQQSHIIYLLELVYKANEDRQLIDDFFEVVEKTVEFMCDFLIYDKQTDTYNLLGPLIPSQEVYDPEDVKNPGFELEYWRFTLGLALKWAARKDVKKTEWEDVYSKMADSPVEYDCYIGHENAENMFERYNHDHPSMSGMFGLIPNDRISHKIMLNTMDKILDTWEMDTMWGWDFAMMAMTATRLDEPEKAVDLLLMDASKNYYAKNGHNYQKTRTDLPVYLPGNGSLLLALSLMTAGVANDSKITGFPANKKWTIHHEDVRPFPY